MQSILPTAGVKFTKKRYSNTAADLVLWCALCCTGHYSFAYDGQPAEDFDKGHIAVVCAKPFHRSLASWIQYRSRQGYSVHVIVEPFSKATVTPQEIKKRIAEVHHKTPLSALLLVGRATAQTVPSPLLPCRIIQQFGEETELASDDWYADMNGDGLPDFAVGRFPVALASGEDTSHDALDTLIQKTIRYESLPPDVWCRQMQLVAGAGHFSPLLDSVIESSALYIFSETFPQCYDISLLHADWHSPFCPFPTGFPAELNRTLNAGTLFWVYLGHGTHREIEPLYLPQGCVPLPLLQDLLPQKQSAAESSHSAVAFLFCCYGGSLDRSTASLAEELVLSGGPVAAVAPSRTAMPYGMSVLAVEMLQTLKQYQNEDKPLTLGKLMLESKYRMLRPVGNKTADNNAESSTVKSGSLGGKRNRSLRETLESFAKMFDPNPQQLPLQLAEHSAMFHLFGDPLLQLPIPKRLELRCPAKTRAGQTLHVTGQTDIDCQNVVLELLPPLNQIILRSPQRQDFRNDKETQKRFNEEYVESNRRVIQRYRVSCEKGQFACDLPLPKGTAGNYVLRGFAKSAESFSVGNTELKIEK
ncbi:MAG: C25 family cysteine peptidase [Planctomycetaceae bacterium]|jgi:hypothetical protein|nr:C25 family cysteine peptidase [Planctomycetaceae bacterium]